MKNRDVGKTNLSVLHEGMVATLQPLRPGAEACFQVQTKMREDRPWNCTP